MTPEEYVQRDMMNKRTRLDLSSTDFLLEDIQRRQYDFQCSEDVRTLTQQRSYTLSPKDETIIEYEKGNMTHEEFYKRIIDRRFKTCPSSVISRESNESTNYFKQL